MLINTFRSDDLLYVAPTALKIDQIYNNVSIALNIIEGDNQLLEEINLLAVFVAWLCSLLSVTRHSPK